MSDAAENDWSKYDGEVGKHTKRTAKYEEEQNGISPKRPILHIIFILYSCIVGLTAVLLGIGNFLVSYLSSSV